MHIKYLSQLYLTLEMLLKEALIGLNSYIKAFYPHIVESITSFHLSCFPL